MVNYVKKILADWRKKYLAIKLFETKNKRNFIIYFDITIVKCKDFIFF